MADSTQITINVQELEKSEKELEVLLKSIENRRVNVSLVNAKGKTADQVRKTEKQLNQIAISMQSLIEKTKNAVANSRVMFSDMDENKLVQLWGVMEK